MRESHDDTLKKIWAMTKASKKKGLDKGARSILMSHSRDMYKYDVLPPAKKFLLAIKEDRIDIMEENLWAALEDLESYHDNPIYEWAWLAMQSKKSKGESIKFILNPSVMLKIITKFDTEIETKTKNTGTVDTIKFSLQNYISDVCTDLIYDAIKYDRPDIFKLLLEQVYLTVVPLKFVADWLESINLKKWSLPDIFISIISYSRLNDSKIIQKDMRRIYRLADLFPSDVGEKIYKAIFP